MFLGLADKYVTTTLLWEQKEPAWFVNLRYKKSQVLQVKRKSVGNSEMEGRSPYSLHTN